jgi:hypothetical protein
LPFRFLLDTGANSTAIPLGIAQAYHIPFEAEGLPTRCFSLSSPVEGYWGSVHILLLGERCELPCFFYQTHQQMTESQERLDLTGSPPHREVPRSSPPKSLSEWERRIAGNPIVRRPALLLGRAVFLDRFSISIRSGKLRITRQ